MKTILKNQEGIALVTTLMLMLLGFGVVVTLMYLTTASAKISSVEQRYATAIESAKGGADYAISMIRNGMFTPPSITGANVQDSACPNAAMCLQQKLSLPASAANWSACNAGDPCTYNNAVSTAVTDGTPMVLPDVQMTLAGCTVFMKIIDTQELSDRYLHTVLVRSVPPSGRDFAEVTFLYEMGK